MNLFKLLGNLGNLSKIQEEMKLATDELQSMRFEGKAGGDMVVVEVDGSQRLTSCTIDAKLIDDNERELIEDLIVAAVNDGLQQARVRSAELLQQRLQEKFDLPDIGSALSSFFPKG